MVVDIMFYDSKYFQENETIHLTFDIPENYFIKMGTLNMKKFTKYILILIATVVVLAACQNKPENGDKGVKIQNRVQMTETIKTNSFYTQQVLTI